MPRTKIEMAVNVNVFMYSFLLYDLGIIIRMSGSLAVDSDGDGLDDEYEVNTSGTSPLLADTDGDGMGDAAEIVAGTSPLDKNSVLRLTGIASESNGGVSLSWNGQTGVSYRIQRSSEIGTLNYDTILTNHPGTEGVMTHTNTPPIEMDRSFYWLKVE